jgi:hypothetical protein
MPALPLDEAGKYVAAAYVVFVLLLVVYIGIMAAKLSRISREIEEVAELAEKRAVPPQDAARETETPVSAGREPS